MTVAAIYARKSTEQIGVADSAKSVVRQVEHARAFAAAKGWSVSEEHIYVDDAISGAEFERRPALQRLKASVRRRGFQYVVVADQSRLGREAIGTLSLIKELAKNDVEIWSYLDQQCITPRGAMGKMVGSVRALGDELQREDAARKATETATTKHARGQVVGGRVFGYKNVDVIVGTDAHGRPLRSHVERVIDEAEATVVLRIFEMFAEGYGLKRIAKALTADGAPAPKPFVRKDPFGVPPVGGWVPSTVRGVLAREDYRGVYVWNRSKKRDEWGEVRQRPRPESEWKRTPMPQWQIVPDALWDQVAARRNEMESNALRFGNGRLIGRPPKSGITNLLAGLATCSVCGGGMVVETYKGTTKKPQRSAHYVCNRRRSNGKCSNRARVPVAEVNEAILQAVEQHALTPEAIEQVIQLAERDDRKVVQTRLEREAAEAERAIARIVKAVENGTDTPSLLSRLKELETRRVAIKEEIADLRPVPRLPREVVETRLAEWRRLLRENVTKGRMVLERVLAGRIVFTPTADERGYTFSAPTRLDKLFSGVAAPPPSWIPSETGGTEDIRTEDTLDVDYEAILARAQRVTEKGVASPPGFEPGFQP